MYKFAYDIKCPACGVTMDGASPKSDKEVPRPPKHGDFGICDKCGSINVYNQAGDKLIQVRATEAELNKMLLEAPETWGAIMDTQAAIRGISDGKKSVRRPHLRLNNPRILVIGAGDDAISRSFIDHFSNAGFQVDNINLGDEIPNQAQPETGSEQQSQGGGDVQSEQEATPPG